MENPSQEIGKERVVKIKELLVKLDFLYSEESKIKGQIKLLENMLDYLYNEETEHRLREQNKRFILKDVSF
jgi:hypothetical protein